ncbi:double zinc ribbon domain-containing protein [Halorubrum luteum]
MSKITFRADDDLVERLESCDASKSEVMRNALRSYLDAVDDDSGGSDASGDGIDGAIADRIDELIADRLDELIADRLDAALDERLGTNAAGAHTPYTQRTPGEINVNVSVEGSRADEADADVTRETTYDDAPDASDVEYDDVKTRKTGGDVPVQTRENACGGCGENVPEDHVYCPNCGEKQSHRAFCECGDEVRTDWAFCPGCGRRTPAADVLKDR